MATRFPRPAPRAVAEFLQWDDGTDTRYELIDGDIVAMNPPHAPHARLAAELGAASREHWIEQPRLVTEILSGSTQKNDITGKLAFYRSVASVDEILLVRFDQRWCELWQRIGANWSIEDHIGLALLPLRITTEPLPLDEIYGPLDL
jgi:Uma2 family endonuclease